MREAHFPALFPEGFRRVAYTEWGERDNPRVLVCVHGLTRNGRDFDSLAEALCDAYRVVCPDVIGRGRSEWLTRKADYGYPLYVPLLATLIAHLGVDEVDWVGTSMGGLIGMFLAASPGTPIRRMVMNDVGPLVPKAALERLGGYVGKAPAFDDIAQLEAYLREVSAPFGPLSDAQWRHLAIHSARREGDKLLLAYDPGIGAPFQGEQQDVNLWPVWSVVRAPVLVVRGGDSDLLLRDTAQQMLARPGTELFEVPGTGHAPMLMAVEQIAAVREFLLRPANG